MTPVQIVIVAALVGLLVTAAVGDIRRRIIPNWLNLAVALLAVAWWWASGYDSGDMSIQIGVAFAALILFGGCFALGVMGGGDVKLIVALALFLTPAKLLSMLALMAIGGGFLTIFMVVVHALKRAAGRPEIPYGVAIAAAALLCVTNDILTTAAA